MLGISTGTKIYQTPWRNILYQQRIIFINGVHKLKLNSTEDSNKENSFLHQKEIQTFYRCSMLHGKCFFQGNAVMFFVF